MTQLPTRHQPGLKVAGDDLPITHSWRIATGVAVAMVMLALVGIGLTTTARTYAREYWMALVPVYGILCVGTAWVRHRHEPGGQRGQVIRQVLHWLAIAVALGLDFVIRGTGEETGSAAGLNALLLLAVGCFLAGVHLEWLFGLVGMLLTFTLIVVAKAEQYLWLIFVGGAVVIAVLIGSRWLIRKVHSRHQAGGVQ